MEKIVCNGIRNKKRIEVVCTRENKTDRWVAEVNAKHDQEAENLINVYAEMGIPFAGTYCPEDEHSAYYAMSAIERYFDSSTIFTELMIDDAMPGDPNIVY